MDGILLFDKPHAWTSHDAVDFIRRRAGQRAVGHAGTLDPMATGLLVLLLGKATKLSASLSGLDKDYLAMLTLGIRTDTQDLEGRILETRPADGVDAARLRNIFASFLGPQSQKTPAYSAVKKEGRKLYEWARQGVSVEAAPRSIVIDALELLDFRLPDASFFLRCSKGTYVRALCDAAGEALGCGAALSALRRTRVGGFLLNDALSEAGVLGLSQAELAKKLLPGPPA